MLTLEIGKDEYYDSSTSQFIYVDGRTIRFEYSLRAIYIWENKWRKAFLKGELTEQESIDFYITMAIDPIEEGHLTADVQRLLAEYIKDTNTATTFSTANESGGSISRPKIYTSEEIYALMITAGIPIEFENRNLNRLLVILRIISAYNTPPKKMSQQDILRQNSELNRQRRAEMKTKG